MSQEQYSLNIKIFQHLKHGFSIYEICKFPSNKIDIKLSSIINALNSYLSNGNINNNLEPQKNFYSIFIKCENGYKNIYQIMKTQNQQITYQILSNKIYVHVELEPYQSQKNSYEQLLQISNRSHQINQKVIKIKDSIQKNCKQLSPDQQKSYDLVYFFSQPLLDHLQRQTDKQVSFAQQYANFIRTFQKHQKTQRSIKIEVMVATQYNIKQVLKKGVNILHFSSHGNQDLSLNLESQFGYQWKMKLSHFIQILQNYERKPSLIVFNACHSKQYACEINRKFPQITTVGYKGEVDDRYCQLFSANFYFEAFKNKTTSIQSLIQMIRYQLFQKYGYQAFILYPYYSNTRRHQPVFNFKQQNISYSFKPRELQHLGIKQPLGIKKQLSFLIKELKSKQKQIILFYGQEKSGKTTTIQKLVRYMYQRKIIDAFKQIDFKDRDAIENVLMLGHYYQNQVEQWLKSNHNSKVVLVLDHCDEILSYQNHQFIDYVRKIFLKSMRAGKIIIIANQNFMKDHSNIKVIQKQQFKPSLKPFTVFISRHRQQLLKQKIDFQIFNSQINRLCKNPSKLIKTLQNYTTSLEILNALQQSHPSYTIIQTEINIQHRFKYFQEKLKEICLRLKYYIESGKYTRLETHCSIVNFLQNLSSIDIVKQQYSQEQMIKFWDMDLHTLLKDVKQFLKIDLKSSKIQQILKTCLQLALRIPNYCYIIDKLKIHLSSQILASLVIIQIIKVKYKSIIQSNQLFITNIRKLKLKLLLTLNCSVGIQQDKIESLRLIKSVTNQISKFQSYVHHQQIQLYPLIKHKSQQYTIQQTDQSQIINTALKMHRQIHQICQIHKSFGDSIHQNQYQIDNYNNLLFQFNQYYRQLKNLQKYVKSKNVVKFCQQNQIKLLYFIGLKFVDVMIWLIKQKYISYSLIDLQEKIKKVGQLLASDHRSKLTKKQQQFSQYSQSSLKKKISDISAIRKKQDQSFLFSNRRVQQISTFRTQQFHIDKSLDYFYKEYSKAYIKLKFNLEQLKLENKIINTTIPLNIYQQLTKRCKEIKVNSYLDQINKHMLTNFSKLCFMFVSIPLFYQFGDKNRYINYYRNQRELNDVVSVTFESLNNQIYYKCVDFTPQRLNDLKFTKSLICLLICDCNIPHRTNIPEIYLQDQYGCSKSYPIKELQHLPMASIVIAYGTNVDLLKTYYEKKQTVFISINHKKFTYHTNSTKDVPNCQNAKNILSNKISNKIFYSFFQCFCSVLFKQQHHNFQQQIKNSIRIARLYAQTQTKMLYCRDNDQIQQIINQLLDSITYCYQNISGNLPIKMKHYDPLQEEVKPSDNLPYKQNVNEIGYNQQLHALLERLYLKDDNNVIIVYTDLEAYTLDFLILLQRKLLKFQKFGNIRFTNLTDKQMLIDQLASSQNYFSYFSNQINLREDQNQLTQLQIFYGVDQDFLIQFTKMYQKNSKKNYNTKYILITIIFNENNYNALNENYRSLLRIYQLRNPTQRYIYLYNLLIQQTIKNNTNLSLDDIFQSNRDLISQICNQFTREELTKKFQQNKQVFFKNNKHKTESKQNNKSIKPNNKVGDNKLFDKQDKRSQKKEDKNKNKSFKKK